MEQSQQALLQFQMHEIVPRFHFRIEKRSQRCKKARYFRGFRQLDYFRFQFGRIGRNLALPEFGIHFPQKIPGKIQENAAISLSIESPFIHGDMVVARNIHAFPLTYMDLLFAVVENHFAGIDVVHRILPRTMYATADIIVKKTVKHIFIVENELHRTKILFFYSSLFHRDFIGEG